jgi:tetratricopeptide (TPR) repeat protein
MPALRLKWRSFPLLAAVFLFLAAVAPVIAASPQALATGVVNVEPRPQLFATLCALYAAGFRPDAVSSVDPSLSKLQDRMLALNGPAAAALRKYYREHALADSTATLSRFVTFALSAGPPPKFELTQRRDTLSPDVLLLDGFGEVLANFYGEAKIDELWREYQPLYERYTLQFREPLATIVLAETGYLREILRPGSRTFTVAVEPLIGATTNFRNIGDEYIVVVSPSSNSTDLIRHAFLHFLLDPLPIRYRDSLISQDPLIRFAARAPRLPYEYRRDSTSFFTECLVRAVELRIQRLPAAQLTEQVNADDADGYILVRPLLGALAKFDAAQPAMTYFFPDLVRSINVQAEELRLRRVSFAPAAEADAAPHAAEAPKAADPNVDIAADLARGERMIAGRDPAAAAEVFQQILEKVPGQPRALYGLAVVSVLQGEAEHARDLFEQVVAAASPAGSASLKPDAATVAWSHVYLGRMHDVAGERDQALEEYRAALAVADAPEAAHTAAQRGIDQGYQPAKADPAPG